jgi:prevent-host-death family protein
MERKINAAAFKARCLALIDEVAETGQPITVTKRGKARVQVVAVREKPKTLIGFAKGMFEFPDDEVVGPVIDPAEWDEDREWRNIIKGFDDPPARYAHRPLGGQGQPKARKGRKARVQRRSRN